MSNSNKICFVSVTTPGCDPRYTQQQLRLALSIEEVSDKYAMMFWTETYPPRSRTHHQSLYGFKVHAVSAAYMEGYRKIIWIDTACILQKPVEPWFRRGIRPVLAARDDNKLAPLTADKALWHFSLPAIPDHYHLVGGSLYVFNFNRADTRAIFNTWGYAEERNIFGAAKEKLGAHRHDETCMALSLYTWDCQPISCEQLGYNSGPDSIVIKKHFK